MNVIAFNEDYLMVRTQAGCPVYTTEYDPKPDESFYIAHMPDGKTVVLKDQGPIPTATLLRLQALYGQLYTTETNGAALIKLIIDDTKGDHMGGYGKPKPKPKP